MAKGELVYNVRKSLEDKERAQRLFYTWNNNAYELGPTLRSRLNAEDQQMIDSMNDEEKAAFEEWQAKQEVDEESKKRALEDSTVSLDTRVSKKGSELSSIQARGKVEYIYKNLDGVDELKLRPYVINKNGVGQAKIIYLGDQMKFLNVSDDQEIIDANRLANINKRVDWDATLNYIIGELSTGARKLNLLAGKEKDARQQSLLYLRLEHLINIIKVIDPKQGAEEESLLKFEESSFQTPDQRRKNKASKSISAKKQKEKDFTYEPPAGKGLTGRGLRGAGVKKNRSYNLADIEGSGKASDLKYKRIGTKFIRKEDLNNNRLKLVFPNRTSVGPIRAMSNELTAMVKDLLYNDNISQQAYRGLPIEDQRVFYEIVKKTHVQHTLQTPIEDPSLTLKAEFDKLRGEIQLGNDNPDMLRELYRLATDMFEQKMISSSEFKTIMSALL